jgi:hypothetical protein
MNVPKAGWERKNQSPYTIQTVLVREMRQESVRKEKHLEFAGTKKQANLRVIVQTSRAKRLIVSNTDEVG